LKTATVTYQIETTAAAHEKQLREMFITRPEDVAAYIHGGDIRVSAVLLSDNTGVPLCLDCLRRAWQHQAYESYPILLLNFVLDDKEHCTVHDLNADQIIAKLLKRTIDPAPPVGDPRD